MVYILVSTYLQQLIIISLIVTFIWFFVFSKRSTWFFVQPKCFTARVTIAKRHSASFITEHAITLTIKYKAIVEGITTDCPTVRYHVGYIRLVSFLWHGNPDIRQNKYHYAWHRHCPHNQQIKTAVVLWNGCNVITVP